MRKRADAIDLAPLQAALAEAVGERDAAREAAANALAGLHVDLDLDILEGEFESSRQRLGDLEAAFGEQPDLERKRERMVEQEQQARNDGDRLLARLQKLNSDANISDEVDRETLERLRSEGSLGADVQNTAVIEREISQVTGKIAALEHALEETRRAADSNLETLRRRSAEAGMILDASDVDSCIERALPQVSKLTGSESAVLESEVQRLTSAIGVTESAIAKLETRLQTRSGEIDLAAVRAEVERLERDIGTRHRAAAIAEQASNELTLRSVSRATRIARTLVPAFTGNTYFDIRILESGEFELWDEDGSRWIQSSEVSAGLRSQVNVAMRLAAAVTSSQLRAAAGCGFLFVDDPISGADKSRRNQIASAIVDGLVSDAFDQVIVMAVEDCLDKRAFDYAVRLDDGRIISSSLPEPKNSAAVRSADGTAGT